MYEDHGFIIRKVSDEKWIPKDQANADYHQYLVWVAEGNEPEVVEL